MVSIDAGAFTPLWRMSADGLREAFEATTRAAVLATTTDDTMTGFAIVGLAGPTAYLQRIAVDPTAQGGGLGRAMVRAAMGWGVQRGATAMLLNTQPDNEASAALYEAEGFHEVTPGLVVLRKPTVPG
jgi:ribosomal protein S18 acetylase RimI-like enzyme